jgi:hypothetical protein
VRWQRSLKCVTTAPYADAEETSRGAFAVGNRGGAAPIFGADVTRSVRKPMLARGEAGSSGMIKVRELRFKK